MIFLEKTIIAIFKLLTIKQFFNYNIEYRNY